MRGEHHACPHRHRKSQQFTLNEYAYCDGGYAEYYYLPPGHYVFTVPDVLPDDAIPPVNCALCQVLHGLEYSEMKFGDTVVIQGAGGLGIYAAAIAAEKGASRVIAIDKQTPRLAMARNCGATDVIDMNELPTPESRVQRVKDLTDGRGADVVMEVVGIAAATLEGLDMVRFNGTFVDIGNIVPAPITLPATKVITQQIKWKGLMHYNPWIMPAALDFLVRTRTSTRCRRSSPTASRWRRSTRPSRSPSGRARTPAPRPRASSSSREDRRPGAAAPTSLSTTRPIRRLAPARRWWPCTPPASAAPTCTPPRGCSRGRRRWSWATSTRAWCRTSAAASAAG